MRYHHPMKPRLSALVLLFAILGCNAPLDTLPPIVSLPTVVPRTALPDSARVFALVPQLTTVGYEVDEEFLDGADLALDRKPAERFKTTIGTTSAISGEIVLDFVGGGVELISAEFSTDLTTLKTNRWQRDANIRNRWLRSNTYPTATFVATEARGLDSWSAGQPVSFQLVGEVQIRGVKQTVTMDASGSIDGNMLTASTRLPLKMTDFGFFPPNIVNVVVVEDDFILFADITARE